MNYYRCVLASCDRLDYNLAKKIWKRWVREDPRGEDECTYWTFAIIASASPFAAGVVCDYMRG